MPYATHDMHEIHPESYVDLELCSLLQTMKLDAAYLDSGKSRKESVRETLPQTECLKDVMAVDSNNQNDVTSESSSQISEKTVYGCAYLQAIMSQLENYATTGGEYLDAIFTHREILFSYPASHQECARGFSDIAYMLEKRAWRADREADIEAVVAFRHEAWVIASTLSPVRSTPNTTLQGTFTCFLPMM